MDAVLSRICPELCCRGQIPPEGVVNLQRPAMAEVLWWQSVRPTVGEQRGITTCAALTIWDPPGHHASQWHVTLLGNPSKKTRSQPSFTRRSARASACSGRRRGRLERGRWSRKRLTLPQHLWKQEARQETDRSVYTPSSGHGVRQWLWAETTERPHTLWGKVKPWPSWRMRRSGLLGHLPMALLPRADKSIKDTK